MKIYLLTSGAYSVAEDLKPREVLDCMLSPGRPFKSQDDAKHRAEEDFKENIDDGTGQLSLEELKLTWSVTEEGLVGTNEEISDDVWLISEFDL